MHVGSIQKDWKITFGKCESEMLPRSVQGELSQKQKKHLGRKKGIKKKLFYIDIVGK